jgi:CheY-like chemotaxis protein
MQMPRLLASSENGPGLSAMTVLIVEDDDLVRDLIARELEEAGYVVVEAVTAEDGLKVLEHQPVNALFTDIRLPGALDGWQLAERARKLDPVLPVIYATGYSEETPRVVTGGVFLRKPYVPSTVMAALDRLLAR